MYLGRSGSDVESFGRRTFATSLIENGADIKAVSTLIGHASVAMTALAPLLIKRCLIQPYASSESRTYFGKPSPHSLVMPEGYGKSHLVSLYSKEASRWCSAPSRTTNLTRKSLALERNTSLMSGALSRSASLCVCSSLNHEYHRPNLSSARYGAVAENLYEHAKQLINRKQ